MKFDILFAGVGGQGVLSVAAAIAAGAMEEGLHIKQTEVHGMSQRGGAVSATLRISDREIASPLMSEGGASLILSMEPLESLRYLNFLSPAGTVITSTNPLQNIANYPPLNEVLDRVRKLPKSILIDTEKVARDAGNRRSANIVLVGAASKFLPISEKNLQKAIRDLFGRKGEKIVEMNLKALEMGRQLS